MLSRVQTTTHRFTVYADSDDSTAEDWFANHSVDVDRQPLPEGGPDPFVSVERRGEFAGVLPLVLIDRLLEPPVVRPETIEELSPPYRALFEVLDDTVYRSMDRSELLAVSREIEDRAARSDTGTLHAGFQRLSVFRSQLEFYRQLAAGRVTVHVYGEDDWTPPAIPGVSFHAGSAGLVGEDWVGAFDGGDDPTRSCAVVAHEEADGYRGFWTDDPQIVARIIRRLRAVDADQSLTEGDSASR